MEKLCIKWWGNKLLKEIVSEFGFDYIKNFQYSILENYNARTMIKDYCESWWKKILGTEPWAQLKLLKFINLGTAIQA